ncbi:MAG TPA: DUF5666 domain-containing protein [Stellaceae bacterium]|nr:DUF5666 domain-containing protein [Stellaceae bacterium]
MKPMPLIAGALMALLALPALAQAPQGTLTNVRGTVATLEGQTLTVQPHKGEAVKVALAPNFAVLGVVKRKRSDIKQGDFVGVAAAPGRDGKLHAQEVLIFPEAARGTGEGHYPWDLRGKGDTMTNGTVNGVVSAARARTLTLSYKGGQQELAVSSRTPVVSFEPASMALLKPGAAVFLRALKQPDGTLVAQRAIVEQNGVKPPM